MKGKPTSEGVSHDGIESLRVALMNPTLLLFEHHPAMFALENIGAEEGVGV